MDLQEKLYILADAAKYDASCASSGSKTRSKQGLGSISGNGICHSFTPDGRCISLLKILMTNFCIFDCAYCINRRSSDVKRARFTPQEIIKLTLDFYQRNYIEGLFLSSGIIRDSDYTMEHLIRVAKTLRINHYFRGYIHLKTIPGAADHLIKEAGLYADRLSVNIELPTEIDLQQLAPEKKRPLLEKNMSYIAKTSAEIRADKQHGFKKTPLFAPGGQSTQMIVGATATPDKIILTTASQLYQAYGLRRVYYSAFSPIPFADARLPNCNPPLMREHRLYQADWLLRFYGFTVDEIVPEQHPNLAGDIDPKTAWALRHPAYFPIDVNRAAKEQLLRIPGIGVQSVNKILQIRQYKRLKLADLLRLKIAFNRAKTFIVAADYHPDKKLFTVAAYPALHALQLPLPF